MICVWVRKNKIDEFVETCKNIWMHETIYVEFYTYPPHKDNSISERKQYVQLMIDYNDYVQLTEKNTFTKK